MTQPPTKTPRLGQDRYNELKKDFEEMKRKFNAIVIVCAELQANSRAQSLRIVTSNYLLQALCAKLMSTEPIGTELKQFLEKLFKEGDQSLKVQANQADQTASVPSPLPLAPADNSESGPEGDQSAHPPPHQEDSEVLTQADPQRSADLTPPVVEATQPGN